MIGKLLKERFIRLQNSRPLSKGWKPIHFVHVGPETTKPRYLGGVLNLKTGRPAGTRTLDPLIKSQLLYQLSYRSKLR